MRLGVFLIPAKKVEGGGNDTTRTMIRMILISSEIIEVVFVLTIMILFV